MTLSRKRRRRATPSRPGFARFGPYDGQRSPPASDRPDIDLARTSPKHAHELVPLLGTCARSGLRAAHQLDVPHSPPRRYPLGTATRNSAAARWRAQGRVSRRGTAQVEARLQRRPSRGSLAPSASTLLEIAGNARPRAIQLETVGLPPRVRRAPQRAVHHPLARAASGDGASCATETRRCRRHCPRCLVTAAPRISANKLARQTGTRRRR